MRLNLSRKRCLACDVELRLCTIEPVNETRVLQTYECPKCGIDHSLFSEQPALSNLVDLSASLNQGVTPSEHFQEAEGC